MYLGDCITIIYQPDSPFGDASEMACAIENSREVTEFVFYDRVGHLIRADIDMELDYDSFSFGVTEGNILWAWNEDTDVHYFFDWDWS